MRISVQFCQVLAVALVLGAQASAAATLAKVNGEVISDEDLNFALGQFTEAQKHNILKEKSSKAQLVESLVDQELFFQAAKKEGLDKTKEYAQAQKAFQKQFLANFFMNKKLGAKLSESAVKQYYEKNKVRFTTAQIHLHQILMDNDVDARNAMAKARAAGADFQALAEQLSKDPTAKNNRGDVGFLTRDQMPVEIGDAVYAAKKGDIIGPIRSQLGFHVVKVVDRQAGKQLSYDEVQLQAKAALQMELTQELLMDQKMKAKIDRL